MAKSVKIIDEAVLVKVREMGSFANDEDAVFAALHAFAFPRHREALRALYRSIDFEDDFLQRMDAKMPAAWRAEMAAKQALRDPEGGNTSTYHPSRTACD